MTERAVQKIIRYFKEPYEKYDGNWKGLMHYERMADRREDFKYTFIFLALMAIIILLVIP